MHNIKVGDTVRIAYNGERDDAPFAYIFNGEICTVTDIIRTTVAISSKAICDYMRDIGETDFCCSPEHLIPLAIEEDIDATYDVLI